MELRSAKIPPVHSREPLAEYNMPFVSAFLVEGGRLVFLAGCGPIPPYHKHPHVPAEERGWMAGGVREQAIRTFQHIEELLRAVGSNLSNVVKLTVYLRDVADQDVLSEVTAKVFPPGQAPPRAVIQAVLNHAGMMLEIDTIAAL